MASLFEFLVMVAILFGIFLFCRALMLWYWKVDKIEEHLAAIRKALEKRG